MAQLTASAEEPATTLWCLQLGETVAKLWGESWKDHKIYILASIWNNIHSQVHQLYI